tara:strand:+ start:150 stop:584 length:435 start_codon:yes stop_codon:yes gene_type:complete
MAKDPTMIARKAIRNLSNAVPDIEAGINAVTESPTAKAADNLDKAGRNYMAAISSGKTARNLRAVSTEDWKRKTLAKVGRIPEGIAQAEDKLIAFHTQRNLHQKGIDAKLKGMAKNTLQDSANRMVTQMNEMAKFSFDKTKIKG